MQDASANYGTGQTAKGHDRNQTSRLQGAEATDELKALRGDQLHTGEREDRERRTKHSRHEGGVAKDREVEHRLRQTRLPADEQRPGDQGDAQRHCNRRH